MAIGYRDLPRSDSDACSELQVHVGLSTEVQEGLAVAEDLVWDQAGHVVSEVTNLIWMSIEIRARLTVLGLERKFIYYTEESLEFNIQALLLACKLSSYLDLSHTFVIDEAETGVTDLSTVKEPGSLLKNG